MKLSLRVLTPGKGEGKTIPITLSQFLIGRDPQCHLRPASSLISKRHCAVLVRNGKAYVRDFDSTNGTFVNEEPVKGEREILDEDKLKVGPLLFTVSIQTTTPVNKPTPAPPPAKTEAKADDDDEVAAMLLALQEDSTGAPASASATDDAIPDGSTVMDIMVPGADGTPVEGPPPASDAAHPLSKGQTVKKEMGNTSLAAKAILDKYTRRPRS